MVSEDSGEIPDYWNDWKLDEEEFNRIIHTNSNALSAIFGYVAEERLREMYLEDHPEIANIRTPEDQDSADKGDWAFTYRGESMKVEVKSLQTHTITEVNPDQQTLTETGDEPVRFKAGFHLKGTSDQREVVYEGETYNTTLMDVSDTDIDIMAVNLYKIKDEWEFAFLRVEDLPRSKGNYPDGLREKLARSQIRLTIPLEDPFTDDLFALMDAVLDERDGSAQSSL